MTVEDIWPLADIAERLGISYKWLAAMSKKRASNGFPEPRRKLGRYNLYDLKEVSEWWTLWQRVHKRLGNGGRLNAR